MKLKKSKLPISTKLMYAGAIVVTVIGFVFLVNNIILFKDTLAYYVDQGVPSNEVLKKLIPQQLLQGIFEPIAIYGGIAFILYCAGKINQKVSKCLTILTTETNSLDVNDEQQEPEEEATEKTNEIQPSEN